VSGNPEPGAAWPALPLEAWADTKATLHRYCQVVGKVRMALVPFRNHWWHVTLYPDTRGLSTGPMPTGDGRALEIAFDLIDHRLVVSASDGNTQSFTLADGLACMDFYGGLFGILDRLGVNVKIRPAPFDLRGPLLSEDREHDAYDPEAVSRYWTVLRHVADVLAEFAGWFNGKQSPVHLFWHSFDLALGRYSGRAAPPRPGADRVTAEAYSHEVIAFGFWPGDEKTPYPAFYSYTAPAPAGLAERGLRPREATWDAAAGTAYLPYEAVRRSPAPRATLLDFFSSAYQAGAGAAGWDQAAFATRAAPPLALASSGGADR
jgi:hypothetical protein